MSEGVVVSIVFEGPKNVEVGAGASVTTVDIGILEDNALVVAIPEIELDVVTTSGAKVTLLALVEGRLESSVNDEVVSSADRLEENVSGEVEEVA
jgi:hypothetical protein